MTGAGGGMGLAIACALRAEGCAVTAIDPKPEPPEFAEGDGAAGRYVRGDASDEALVARTVADTFDVSGRLDYLVNAAGVGWYDRDGLHCRDGNGDLAPGDGGSTSPRPP